MKKIFFAVAVFLSTSAFAQTTWQWGIKAGGNISLSQLKLTDPASATYNGLTRPGVWGGGLLEFSPARPNNEFKIQLEALYSSMNAEFSPITNGLPATAMHMSIQQLNVPLLLKYYVLPYLSINVGPTFNFNFTGKERNNPGNLSNEIYINQFNIFQYGAGAGVTYYVKRFFVDARFNYLFGQVNNTNSGNASRNNFPELSSQDKVKFNTVSLGIGYTFKIKRHPKQAED